MGKDDKRVVAAFDFDGTITTKDTLFDFISFCFGKRTLILGLFLLSPILVAYKIGFIKNSRAKEILFSYFFKNTDINDFNSKCNLYSKRIDEITRKSTVETIKKHQQKEHDVIIVSASISNWIKPWAKSIGINIVLGTEIEIRDDKITGKFSSNNCYGQEKVNRLLKQFPDRSQYTLYAYGDSEGDKELLSYADYPTLIKK